MYKYYVCGNSISNLFLHFVSMFGSYHDLYCWYKCSYFSYKIIAYVSMFWSMFVSFFLVSLHWPWLVVRTWLGKYDWCSIKPLWRKWNWKKREKSHYIKVLIWCRSDISNLSSLISFMSLWLINKSIISTGQTYLKLFLTQI